jgi:hypothetical protein
MGTFEKTTRPLTDKERRFVSSALARHKDRTDTLPRRSLFLGLGLFAFFAVAMTATTFLDKRGPAWYYCLLISLAIAAPISLWSYFEVKLKVYREVDLYEGALRRDEATVIRIQSNAMIEFEEKEDEGACYAFQLDNHQLIFISGQDYYPSAKFPNSDFSIVEIHGEDGKPIESVIEKNGSKLKPLRKLSWPQKRSTSFPEDLEIIEGDLDNLEEVLTARQKIG